MLMRNSRNQKARAGPAGRFAALAVMLIISMLILTGLPASADFTKAEISSVRYNPTKPQPGATFTLSVTVKNTYSSDLHVKWFGVHYDWMAANTYENQDMSSSPMVITPLTSWTFTLSIPLPASANYTVHPYNFKMGYDVNSYSYNEKTNDYLDFVVVKYTPPPPTPFWQQPLFIVLVILVLVMVLVLGIFFIVRQRRIAREHAKTRFEFKTTGSTGQTPDEVELARTVTKHHAQGSAGPVSVDSRPRPWEAAEDKRFAGQPPKPPIYQVLSPPPTPPGQAPQSQPSAWSQTPPPQSGQAPQPMPAAPPPRMMPQAPPPPMPQSRSGVPPPLPPAVSKNEATLHQCPMCGKMNKASDTVCPKCGNKY